ncbi:MAG: nitroreductase [Gammaproteobacteria bacterium]|nr:nitroreductase [Gammaproteobacteria bacterium]
MTQRHSCRAFVNKAVSHDQIERMLTAARHAPSGANTQPWQVAVVSGNTKKTLQQNIEHAFNAGETSKLDYQYYPVSWKAPYKKRRSDCGLQLYAALDITRGDADRRRAQWAANYRSFDAPVMLLFFIDPIMETGSYLDYGMFLQSIMLAAMEEGLATCAQAALAEYPQIVKQTLGYPDDQVLLCGMAIGYEDTDAAVNRYRTPREDVSVFTQFFD